MKKSDQPSQSPAPANALESSIKDNHYRGKVGEYLRQSIPAGATLSVVSAYFTIYAYEALKAQLDQVDHLNFLFGEPSFVRAIDPGRADKKSFDITDHGLHLHQRLQQKRAARECADWITSKVTIKSIKRAGLLHGKLYHIDHASTTRAIVGSSNFTSRGLGLAADGNNIELNVVVDSDRDRHDQKAWFDQLWADEALVEDVTREVLDYLCQLYENHSPEFIYYRPCSTCSGSTGRAARQGPAGRKEPARGHGDMEGAVRVSEGRRQRRHQQDPGL
jgi:hypothetical protein